MKEEEDALIDFLLPLSETMSLLWLRLSKWAAEEEEAEAEVAAADMVVEAGTAAVADIWRRVEDEKIGIAIWQPRHSICDLDHHGFNAFLFN